MPYVINEGARLYWEAHGSGSPILLIIGLSFTHEMWFRILPALAGRHRVILFDNRGMGRSSVPPGPYSIPKMARDAGAVLEAAGESAAHVIGASMGGMIAQELALKKPDLVRSLLLGCTTHSGLFGRWPDFSAVPRRGAPTRLDRERSIVKLLYADTTPQDRIEEDLHIRCGCEWSNKGFLNQFAGILMWSAYRRLPRIQVPTLVVHGDQDRLVPAENGKVVAQRIPNARFELVKNAGHVMTTDQPEICSGLMLEFLAGQAA
ncbi:MAG: alpha/beta hydrolase [Acidobacteriota bacterium]|nr:alpha/beta hydrolase [Acidobacteriota bacterium]